VHSKSRVAVSKEAKKVIPLLTVLMRCGCLEAEKVQHYGAIIICNVLSMFSTATIVLKDLLKTGAVVDLVVVTLLRINSNVTKECLVKSFFNLLSIANIRHQLVINLDILASILEITKVEYISLLELCVRIIYNVSCELKPPVSSTATLSLQEQIDQQQSYVSKFVALKMPQFVFNKLNYSPDTQGSLSNKTIRLLLGMILANMSFHESLVVEMCKYHLYVAMKVSSSSSPIKSSQRKKSVMEKENENEDDDDISVANNQSKQNKKNVIEAHFTISKALSRVYFLDSEEARYCAVVTLHNISLFPIQSKVLANNKKGVDLLVDLLINKDSISSILCIKLAVACLCNFSLLPEFHELLSETSVIKSIVKVLSAPQFHLSVKLDAIQFVYNLLTSSNRCKAEAFSSVRITFIENDGVIALWKLLKVQGVSNANDTKVIDNNTSNNNKNLSLAGTNKKNFKPLNRTSATYTAFGKTKNNDISVASIKSDFNNISLQTEVEGEKEVNNESNIVGEEDEKTLFKIARIVKDLCSEMKNNAIKIEKKNGIRWHHECYTKTIEN